MRAYACMCLTWLGGDRVLEVGGALLLVSGLRVGTNSSVSRLVEAFDLVGRDASSNVARELLLVRILVFVGELQASSQNKKTQYYY